MFRKSVKDLVGNEKSEHGNCQEVLPKLSPPKQHNQNHLHRSMGEKVEDSAVLRVDCIALTRS